jgi:hypothetical protein
MTVNIKFRSWNKDNGGELDKMALEYSGNLLYKEICEYRLELGPGRAVE